MLCREGPSSGTPRWGYPSHRYRGGPHSAHEPRTATPLRRPLPASHAQMMFPPDPYPPQTVRKVLARLKYSVPIYKAESGFSILTEECLTFRTISPDP